MVDHTTFRMLKRLLPVIGLICILTPLHSQESVGIGTNSPASSAILDISSTDKGVLFPRMTTVEKESIGNPDEGLILYDLTLGELQIYRNSAWETLGGLWSEHPNGGIYHTGFVGIGDAPDDNVMLSVYTNNLHTAGEYINLSGNSGVPTTGLYVSSINNNAEAKRGGRFSAVGNDGQKTGLEGSAIGDGGENIGIYGYAQGAASINRAGWFGDGDVAIDNQLLVGSTALTDEPDGSALLELRATDMGLLLPRMTANQRNNITSPAEGLLVYDTDSAKVFVRKSASWQSLGDGGGSGSSHWDTDGSGIYYDAGNVGIGATSQGYIGLRINTEEQLGIDAWSIHTGSSPKIGVQAIATSDGTGTRYGVYGYAASPSSGSTEPAFGVYGDAGQSSSSGNAYGIYGSVSGTGSGERWAGYFDGSVRASEQLVVGNETPGMPEQSAVLELQSTDKGFLLPRMTATERNNISSPAEGLLVYDTDSSKVFLRKSVAWEPIGSGGGGGGPSYWTEDTNPVGIYFNGGNVGIGDQPSPLSKFFLKSSDEQIGQWISTTYSGGLDKYGLFSQANANGTGSKYGVYSEGHANASDSSPAYGVYGIAQQYTSDADVFGIYGFAGGTGTGERWAGYFNGQTKVTGIFHVGDGIEMSPTGYESGSELILRDNDGTNTIVMHGNQFTSQGAQMTMADEGGDVTLLFDSDFASHGGGGLISMKDENSNNRIVLEAKESSTQGAALRLYNDANIETIEFDAEDNGSGDDGGFVAIRDKTGGSQITLSANEEAGNGSVLKMFNLELNKTVEIDGDYGTFGGGYFTLQDINSNERLTMYANEQSGDGASLHMYNNAGVRTIELDADFGGDGRVITSELEITGGSDLAEYFSASDDNLHLQPGSVVVVDQQNPGKVKPSKTTYDKKVVGVISGANGIQPGMYMGQKESIAFGNVPVAIAGRVYVKTDSEGGNIEPGDFLTTSSSSGKAMKVNDWDQARGAILGKALTSPDEHEFVLILVTLQ